MPELGQALRQWSKRRKQDVYIVGAANVGKSTLVNRLLADQVTFLPLSATPLSGMEIYRLRTELACGALVLRDVGTENSVCIWYCDSICT